MAYYITAHHADGSPVLGNLDGQTVLRTRRPDRSAHWQQLGLQIRASARIAFWRIEDSSGRVLATKSNPRHEELL